MNYSNLAYESIKLKILNQEVGLGSQLKEAKLAADLHITRTPVREALIRLDRDGVVRTYPNRGAFVAVLGEKEIEDLFDVREALEIKGVHLAIGRANKEELEKVREGIRERNF